MVNLGSGMKLVARHNKRTPAARARDEKETHRITVSLRDDHPLGRRDHQAAEAGSGLAQHHRDGSPHKVA